MRDDPKRPLITVVLVFNVLCDCDDCEGGDRCLCEQCLDDSGIGLYEDPYSYEPGDNYCSYYDLNIGLS